MPTPVLICGFECGVTSSGTAKHVTALGAGCTFDTTTVRSGLRSARVNVSNATTAGVQMSLPSGSTVVARFYVRFASLPSADIVLANSNSTSFAAGVSFKQSDSKLYANAGGSLGATGVSVTTGVWYMVEYKITVSGTTVTVDARVDATDLGQITGTNAYTTTALTLGSSGGVARTMDIYFDDVLVSQTAGDYPLGSGKILSFVPDADGTHTATSTNIVKGTTGTPVGTAITSATTDAYTFANARPLGGGATDNTRLINQQTNATEYVELDFESTGETNAPTAIDLVALSRQAGTASGNWQLKIVDNGSEDASLNITAAGTTSDAFQHKVYATQPNGGAAWTLARFNALKARFGYSTDANPDQYLRGVMIEADFPMNGNKTLYPPAGQVDVTGLAPKVNLKVPTDVAALTVTGFAPTISVLARVVAGLGAVIINGFAPFVPERRYWVGGSGTWDSTDTSHWSATSGGASGASVPTAAYDVYFDANSGGGTITLGYSQSCFDLNTTGFSGTIVRANGYTLGLNGNNIVLSAGLTLIVPIFCYGDNTTFKSNSATIKDSIAVIGSLKLLDNLACGYVDVVETSGSFDANGFTVTTNGLYNGGYVNFGGGLWEFIDDLTTATPSPPYFEAAPDATQNIGSSNIKFTSALNGILYFYAGGRTYNDVWFSRGASTGGIIITGANTFNEFKYTGTAAHTITFPNVTTTVTSFAVNGSAGNLITLQRTGTSGTWTLVDTSGTNDCDYLSISNCVATGGATWNAGANSIDGGGNTGWNFSPSSSITPATAAVSLTGLAPTVTASDHQLISTALGQLTITGLAPIIKTTLKTDVGALTLTGLGPTVTASDHQVISTLLGEGVLTGLAPTVTTGALTRYWVGGSGTWDSTDTSHWSATSGGASGASVPTAAYDVYFDANSGGGTISCTADYTQIGKTLTTTGFSGTITGFQAGIYIYGDVVLSATTTISVQILYIYENCLFTRNNATLNCAIYAPLQGKTLYLNDELVLQEEIWLSQGALTTNNHNITCGGFYKNIGTGTINLGSSLITLTLYDWEIGSGATVNAGTSTIKFIHSDNSTPYFKGGGKTYNNLWMDRGASTGGLILTGANTFNELKDTGTAAHTITFPNVTTTVNSFVVSGSAGNLITLQRTGASGTWTLSDASGTNDCYYLSISNSAATGGATFNAINSTDGGGNTGWNFSAVTLLFGEAGSFSLAGQSASVLARRTLPISAGTFNVSGQGATLLKVATLAISSGSFVISGGNNQLRAARKITAEPGACSLSGQGVLVKATRTLPLASGTFSFAGQPAATKKGSILSGAAGVISAAGQPSQLRASKTILSAQGSLALSGQPATITARRTLPIGAGNFLFSGQPMTTRATRRLPLAAGSFSISGQPASVQAARRLPVSNGSLSLTGQNATLGVTVVNNAGAGYFSVVGQGTNPLRYIVLLGTKGSISLTGNPLNLLKGNKASGVAGSFVVLGQGATIKKNGKLLSAGASFTLTGQPSLVRATRSQPAAAGSFTLSGQPGVLKATRVLGASGGLFTFSAHPAAVGQTKKLTALPGAFTFTGQSSGFAASRRITASPATVTCSGQALNIRVAKKITSSQGSFTVGGQNTGVRKGYHLALAPATITLSGWAASLTKINVGSVGYGSYSLSGKAAQVTRQTSITITGGSFTVTGGDIGFQKTSILAGQAGSFTLSGQQSIDNKTRAFLVDCGFFVLSGSDALQLQIKPKLLALNSLITTQKTYSSKVQTSLTLQSTLD